MAVSMVLAICMLSAAGCSSDGTAELELEIERLTETNSRLEEQVDRLEREARTCCEVANDSGDDVAVMVEIPVRREGYDDLPEEIKMWAGHFIYARVGAYKVSGDRVYIILSLGGSKSSDQPQTGVRIACAYWTGSRVQVEGRITAPGIGNRFDVASVEVDDWPDSELVEFKVESVVSGFDNSLGLSLVELPVDERIVVTTPAPGETVRSPLSIRGFARLFEGYVSVRLINEQQEVIATRGSSCGSYSWDSFQTDMEFTAPPGTKLVLWLLETASEGDDRPYGVTIPLVVGEGR